MAVYLGDNIANVYLGDVPVRLYLGDALVFDG